MSVFYRNKGAISVFLVIILVPCMLVASIFVDISRVELGKAVAESSADLALNTLMSNYDYDLSDYYGLIGSCNDISEYYDVISDFYETGLHSRDMENEEIKLLYQEVANEIEDRFKDEAFSDILQIKNLSEGNVAGPLDNASMYNAAILQKQIVEFMKYRGPIVITQDIIEKIRTSPGVNGFLEGNKNEPLTEGKTEFYKAEGGLLEIAFDVYWKTRDYTDKAEREGMSARKLAEYADALEEYRSAYREIHRLLVGNLMNTSHLKNKPYSRVTIDLDKYIGTVKISKSKVSALFNELEQAKTDFEDAISDFNGECSLLMDTPPGDGADDAHYIQWWVQMEKAVNAQSGTNYTSVIEKKADAMVKAYAKVSAIGSGAEENDVQGDWQTIRETLLTDVEALHAAYLTEGQEDEDDEYLKAVNLLEEVSNGYVDKIDENKLLVAVDGSLCSLPTALSVISTRIDGIKRSADEYITLLDLLLKPKNFWEKCLLDQLIDAAKEYNTSLNSWSDIADRVGTTQMAQDHQEEIDGIRNPGKDTPEEIHLEINEQEVRILKDRLTNIRSQFQIISDAVSQMKYGGKCPAVISTLAELKNRASGKVKKNAIGLTQKEVESYAQSTFAELFQPLEETIAQLHDTNDSRYDPVMRPDRKEVDTPDLYLYFHQKFHDKPRDPVKNAKKDQEDAEEARKRKEEEKDKDRYHGGGTDIAGSEASSGDGFQLGKAMLGSLITLVGDLKDNRAYTLRDNLYTTVYIMHMFSYATYETEGCYSLIPDDKKTKLKLPGAGGSYYPSEYDGHRGSAEVRGTWLSTNPEDSYNKSLTNKMIDKDNNAAYLAEVEYILYGKSNEGSVKEAYKDIFEIRYVLNLVSAFANFWSGGNPTADIINSIAGFIASATSGIVPAPLTKVILLPILTLFETLKDLERLEAGFPVEIYKMSADDWWCSVPNDMSDEAGINGFLGALTGERENPGKGLQYSDYLTLFVCMGLMQGDKTSEKMYLRMADVIQANMRKVTKNEEYALTNTQVYFYLKSKLRVDPLMLTLPIFSDETQDLEMKEDWCTFNVEIIRGY